MTGPTTDRDSDPPLGAKVPRELDDPIVRETVLAYAALVALLRGPCDAVAVEGEVVVAEDGVIEIRGNGSVPGRMVIQAGCVPGVVGTLSVKGGAVGDKGEGGGNVVFTMRRGDVDMPVFRVCGGKAERGVL